MTSETGIEKRAVPGTPLYVHLPFCAAKCHYCDFFSVAGEGQDVDGMVVALLREAEWRAPRSPRTVFFGGGTPSYLEIAQLRAFLDGLDRLTDFRASATEVTAECNPESLSLEKARALRELGVTRLSIGFQSLQPSVLELFGRVHSVDQSFRAFEAARAAGFERVSIDLIYASPGQTSASWRADLGRVLALRPDHLSAYNLTFEEETPFATWLENGTIAPLDDELELELLHTTRELCGAHELFAYEVSNYARTGEACLHNLNYWKNGEYAGLGPSAASKIGYERSGNARSISLYRRAIEKGERPVAWRETPSDELRLAETWWLGLRLTEGVDPAEARRTAGWSRVDGDPALAVAERLVAQGFLERTGARYRSTRRGLELADAVAREFLQPAKATTEVR